MLHANQQIEPENTEIVAADDSHRRSVPRPRAVVENMHAREIAFRRRFLRSEHTADDGSGARTEDAELGDRSAHVRDLDILAEHELLEMPADARCQLPFEIDQDGLARLDDVHVGDHAALSGQKAGVTARTGRQRDDVVGQQALQVVAAVFPGEPNAPAI